jgi:uncharacterized protein involved in exopolysaccharide biosynthesis
MMTPDREDTMAGDESGYDLDLGRLVRAVARGWWIVLVFVVVGAASAYGVTRISGGTYEATSSVYLGIPTDASGTPLTNYNTTPKAMQIVQSDAVLREAARTVGMGLTPAMLRANLTLKAPTVSVRGVTSPANFLNITVTDTQALRAARAANVLAEILVKKVSGFAESKIAMLKRQVAVDDVQIVQLNERITSAQDALAAIAAGAASDAEKAAASAPYVAVLDSSSNLRMTLLNIQQERKLDLLVAKQVEMASVFSRAGVPVTKTRASTAMAAGAGVLAGFVVGVIVAAVVDRRRRPPVPAAA